MVTASVREEQFVTDPLTVTGWPGCTVCGAIRTSTCAHFAAAAAAGAVATTPAVTGRHSAAERTRRAERGARMSIS